MAALTPDAADQRAAMVGSPSFLSDNVPPMGIYETLYAFADEFGAFMGTAGTHPWSQGFPLTTPLDRFNGPELPASVEVTFEDRFYPKAWGHPLLRNAIAAYYNTQYGCSVAPENVMVFAGGRPGIFTILAFLKKKVRVRIGSVEWPAYMDILAKSGVDFETVPFTKDNHFHPPNAAYFEGEGEVAGAGGGPDLLPVISNPSNPTGHTRSGAELEELIAMAEQPGRGILLDEAYEWFHAPGPVSGLQYVRDLESSNCFFTGACTKGLQCPGIRVGWVVASRANIETLANYSSFGMGGVSHPSQLYAVKLLGPTRVARAIAAVRDHYGWQRERYGRAFAALSGLTIWTGDGGFYHWLELPAGMTSKELNRRLFKRGGAILTAWDCDMARPHDKSEYETPYTRFFRFSFGPLLPETFEKDMALFREVYEEYLRDSRSKPVQAQACKRLCSSVGPATDGSAKRSKQ